MNGILIPAVDGAEDPEGFVGGREGGGGGVFDHVDIITQPPVRVNNFNVMSCRLNVQTSIVMVRDHVGLGIEDVPPFTLIVTRSQASLGSGIGVTEGGEGPNEVMHPTLGVEVTAGEEEEAVHVCILHLI